MSTRAWMPMYWGDYFADTRHLTTLQHGAYMLLIGAYWTRGSLPDDATQLRQICQLTTEEWDACHGILEALFLPGWKHKRIDEELAKIRQFSHRQQLNARNRWKKRIMPPHASGNARARASSPSPSPLRKKEERKKVPASDEAMEPVPEPVDEDPKARLYRIAKTILVSFGIPDKRTGALIGMWLKTRPDPVGLLAAIQYARDQNVAEPVAYITTLVNGRKPNGQHGRRWDPEQVARDLIDEIHERQRAEGPEREDEHH